MLHISSVLYKLRFQSIESIANLTLVFVEIIPNSNVKSASRCGSKQRQSSWGRYSVWPPRRKGCRLPLSFSKRHLQNHLDEQHAVWILRTLNQMFMFGFLKCFCMYLCLKKHSCSRVCRGIWSSVFAATNLYNLQNMSSKQL